jgi:ABC-type multidrug transport system ATPase subunit
MDADVRAEEERVSALLSSSAQPLRPTAAINHADAVLAINLRREFPDVGKVALHGLSLGIPEQTTFGLLGTNGAGKTTMLRLVTGQDVPTSGDVIVAGHSLLRDVAGTSVVRSCTGLALLE